MPNFYLPTQQITHEGRILTLKNLNQTNVQWSCRHSRAEQCPFQVRCPVVNNKVILTKPWTKNLHSRGCCSKTGFPFLVEEGDTLWGNDDDNKNKSVILTYTDIKHEMKSKTEEFSTKNLTMGPQVVWAEVKRWANEEYGGNWCGLKEHQVTELVRKCRKKLGLGDAIGTIENTPDYNKMTNQDRPFLQGSMCFPHPDKQNTNMRAMMFANPELLGLLNGRVDIFIDATFDPCTPHLFYQCLIVMVFNPSTSSYVPVIYTLMTHKCTELYWQVFNQVKVLTKNKMEVCTYTSDFERAEMNTLEAHFGDPDKKKHVGCFFHLKQAWFKYLKEKLGMGLSSSIGLAMATGGLDILCVLPQDEVVTYGIPFL